MDTGETREGEYKVSWADFQSSVTLSYLQNITLQIYTYVVRYAYLQFQIVKIHNFYNYNNQQA